MALATMQKKHLGRPDEVARFDRITKENVILDALRGPPGDVRAWGSVTSNRSPFSTRRR